MYWTLYNYAVWSRMEQTTKERISAVLHVSSIFPVFLMAAFIEFSVPLPIKIAASLGIFLLGLGASSVKIVLNPSSQGIPIGIDY